MNKLLIACMSTAFALSVNAADWFNGGLSQGATETTAGSWTKDKVTVGEPIALTPESGEVAFTVDNDAKKSLDSDVVTITSTVALTAYDELPEVASGTKAALAPVDDGTNPAAYYGLVNGAFVKLTGATPTDEAVTVTIQMRKVLGQTQVKYNVGGTDLQDANGNTWIYTDVTAAPTEVAYSGTGTVSGLVGETDEPTMATTLGTAETPALVNKATLEILPQMMANGLDTTGANLKLSEDIALTGTVTPIGAGNNKDNRSAATFGDTAFKGVFDGDNHTISGVILPCQDYVGLFGSTLGATIKNLKVSLGNATGFDGVTTGDGRTEEYSGAPIVGCALNTTIENCETVATEGAVFTAAKAAAGIVGYAGSGTTVKDCTNNLPIKSTTNAKAAGIVGCAQDATGDHLNGGVGLTIDGCANTGTVTGKSGGNGSGLVTYTDNAVTFKGANSTTAGDVVSVIYLNSGSITLEEGATFAVPADKKTVNKNAVDGLQLATVSEGVATLVKAEDVTTGGSYKVMAAGATITLANVGDSITLDETLATADVTTTAENAKVTKSGNTYTVEQDLATVGFTVIIAENANVEATVKIDGETVETVPSTLTEGQTYAVTFAPVDGYMFETVPEPVSGTVGTTDITVNAPSAVKIVAMAGEVPCASLQAALTLGGTVTLAADTTVAEWQIVDKAVTLDLGSHTLSAAETFTSGQDAVLAVKHGGSLTVKNGTIDGASVLCGIKLSQNAADVVDPYTDENKAVVVVDGATVIGREFGISGNGKAGRGNTAVTVKSGTVKATAANGVGIYNPQTGTVLVEDGTVEAPAFGVYAKSGTVTIEGGVVKATATEAVNPSVNNNGTSGQGYAVVLEKGTASGGYANGLTATITGGTFESVGAPVLSWTRDTATAPALAGLITDGKFKGSEMDAALIASQDDMIASWTTDGDGYQTPTWTEDTAPRTLIVGAGVTGEFHVTADTKGTKEGTTKEYTIRPDVDTIVLDETFKGDLFFGTDSAKYTTPVNVIVKSGEVTVGHCSYDHGNFPSGSTVEVKEGATLVLRRWGKNENTGSGTYAVNVDGVKFTGDGDVKVVQYAASVNGTIDGDAKFDVSAVALSALKSHLVIAPTWAGTVVLPEIERVEGDTNSFWEFGNANSKIELKGLGGGWVPKSTSIVSTLVLDGEFKLNDWSQSYYTFAAIEGAGAFTVVKEGTYYPVSVTVKMIDAAKYTGTVKANVNLTISSLVTALEAVPETKAKVLAFAEGTDTTKITVAVKFANGEPVDATNVFVEANGIYVGPAAQPTVDPVDPETPKAYDTPAEAEAAAEAINADKENLINAPEGVTKTDYVANFEAVVTEGNTVVVQLTETAEAAVQKAVDDAQATVLNPDENGKATIVTKPGLYYGIAAVEELDAMEDAQPASWTMAEGDSLKLEVTKPSATKGFYRVMSTVKPAAK